MEHCFISWPNLTKFWLEEHDTRLVGLRNSQKVIKELQRQLENAQKGDIDPERLCAIMEDLYAREEQQRLNRTLVDVFNLAWDELNSEEKNLLETVHRRGLSKNKAFKELADQFYCSESTVRRHYKKALNRFQHLLLG